GKRRKYGRHCALKMTNRRLTHSAVAQITHIGAPTAISGIAASCALPANTAKLMNIASGTDSPPLTMATPVTRPQAAMPRLTPAMSLAPARNWGCAATARRDCIARLSPLRVNPARRALNGPGSCSAFGHAAAAGDRGAHGRVADVLDVAAAGDRHR